LRNIQSAELADWSTPTVSDAMTKPRVQMADLCDHDWKEGRLIAIHPHDDPNAPEYNGELDFYCEDENGETLPYLHCRIKKINNIANDLYRENDRLQLLLDAEIEANKDMSKRELELVEIVKRNGGWKTEDGHWVCGFDTVEYTGADHGITVRSTADSVPKNQRHLYTKTLICPHCGSVMWTTEHSGTFCRECIKNENNE